MVAPNAYMPMPGSTVASSAIFTSATRMPSITTSSIDQTSRCASQRSISPAQRGIGERRAASSSVIMNARYPTGAIKAQNATSTLVTR